ncbi:hypothetical protein CQ14_03045 [Bradyrhizobium lablabi]|uniref:Uncharacterized protein n=1 Tax=Bradyrhizobium lablabi TaxID=722472 RepID=A0A0R3N337_9BRAD|nr:hypothetical protein [Bradyrhizobium lablabi]KRR26478.1 hypothetical protein CQ14_03045 [Bradyrhizobium lablabi]
MPVKRKPTPKNTAKAKAAEPEPAKPAGMSQTEIATLLGVTQQRVSQLIQQGVFQTANGRLSPWQAVPAYIRSIKVDDGTARIRAAKAIEIETRNAKERSELISLEDVNYAVGMIASKFCGELAGVAAASTRDLGLREIIQSHLTAAILRFKASLDAVAADAKAGRPIVDDGGSDDED